MNDCIYQKNLEYRLRTFGKKFYLFNYTKTLEINEVGKMIWDLIDGEKTVEEIAKEITRIYDIDVNTAQSDVSDYIQKLIEIEAIQ